MTSPVFVSRSDAKDAKWFSRRHETPEAHNAAVQRYKATRGKEARRARAAARLQSYVDKMAPVMEAAFPQ